MEIMAQEVVRGLVDPIGFTEVEMAVEAKVDDDEQGSCTVGPSNQIVHMTSSNVNAITRYGQIQLNMAKLNDICISVGHHLYTELEFGVVEDKIDVSRNEQKAVSSSHTELVTVNADETWSTEKYFQLSWITKIKEHQTLLITVSQIELNKAWFEYIFMKLHQLIPSITVDCVLNIMIFLN